MENNSLEGLLRQYINNSIAGLFTAIPARITQVVNAGEQRVDVQPLVSRVTTDDITREHPVILSVPLIYPGSSTSQFSFPVNIGDTVLLIFSQRSIDRFKQGAESPHRPLSFRRYSRQDAMAIPGLYSFPEAANQPSKHSLSHDTDDVVISHNLGAPQENEVRLKKNGAIEVNAAADTTISFSINGSKVLDLSSSEANFNIPVTGPDFTTDDGVSLNNHTHSQGNDSDNNSQVETNPPTTS